jgi:hypothetical protein
LKPNASAWFHRFVPEKELDGSVEILAKELASRNGATLENAKIAAYMQKDLPFDMALRADDLVQHRLRYYTNPLSDVEGYLHSQKGGGTVKYVKPENSEVERSWVIIPERGHMKDVKHRFNNYRESVVIIKRNQASLI